MTSMKCREQVCTRYLVLLRTSRGSTRPAEDGGSSAETVNSTCGAYKNLKNLRLFAGRSFFASWLLSTQRQPAQNVEWRTALRHFSVAMVQRQMGAHVRSGQPRRWQVNFLLRVFRRNFGYLTSARRSSEYNGDEVLKIQPAVGGDTRHPNADVAFQ